MDIFKAIKPVKAYKPVQPDNSVWVVSWISGTRFNRKSKKYVPDVQELTVVGTGQAAAVAQRVVCELLQHMGITDANEAVQMKRAGCLA
jgi:hypothetical protein